MPYTVEKGLNAIKADSGQPSQERRPKLMRDYSVGSETDLSVLAIHSESDPKCVKTNTTIASKLPKTSITSSNTNYFSLV